MPIYNGIEFINDSITSILSQTYNEWELIIGINGHSQNSNTYEIAKKYEEICGKIKVLDLFTMKGKSNALNYMLKFCRYDYIALLDVDDIWHPQKLEIQTQLLNNYDIIGSRCKYFGEISDIIPNIPCGDISNFDFSIVNPIINSSSIIKKNLCYWCYWNDGIEDYDLWLRLRKQNKKFFNFEEILVLHRIHNTSAFNSKGNNNKVYELLVSHGYSPLKI